VTAMTTYTYKGSIPTELPEGVTEEEHLAAGWIVAPDKPDCPEGKEVVWLNWEWVIRDPKPEDIEGFQWNWDHGNMDWVESPYVLAPQLPPIGTSEIGSLTSTQIAGLNVSTQIPALTVTQLATLTSTQISGL
jgi:hypothetical protein